ncbi:MAG: DEAD/DEAH box helicase [Clostridium perfringens]|nr:DEAD/DEAH box helicase [Clostridium perfringens]
MKIKELVESILNSSSSLNLGKGKKRYEESIIKDIKGKKIDTMYHIYGAVKDDRKFYNTHIKYDLTHKKTLECRCGCEEFNENYKYKKNFLCEHLVATTFKFNELVDKKVKSTSSLENNKNKLIYKTTNLNNLLESTFLKKEELSLEVYINEIESLKLKYYQIEFKIRGKGLYSINNIKEFVQCLLNFKNFKVNYDFTYNIDVHEFLARDYEIVYFLKEFIDLNEKINDGLNKNFKLFNGKYFNLLPGQLYRFLKILEEKDITFIKNLVTYKAKILRKSLPISFTIKEKDSLLLLTTKKILPLPLNKDFNVFLYDRNIYIPKVNEQRVYREFYNILKDKGVILFEKNLKTYEKLMKLLNVISKDINLSEGLYRILGDMLKTKFSIKKENENINCYLTLSYGEETFDFFEENNFLRNREREREVVIALERLKFIKRENKFLFIGDDYDLYYFLKEGVGLLKKFGSIEFLNDFDKLRPYNSKNIKGQLSLMEKRILFKYDFPFLDNLEFENLFTSFKNKEPFYKTKDNNFIDLTDKKVTEFLNMALILDIGGSSKGYIEIDENKGIYLFNKLKRLNIDISGEDVLNKLYNEFESIKKEDIKVPKDLNASLRSYQVFGVKWLLNIAKLGFSGILADDMGLGKTIQIITFLLLEKEYEKKSLIVVPTSLIYNWIDELKKFAPSLNVKIVYGDTKKREHILSNEKDYDLLLTTYGTLKMDYDLYKEKDFDYFIIDEAQTIKNPKAQITKYVKNINSKVRFALTGTPIENTLVDLWSIFDFLMCGYLKTKEEFDERFKNSESLKELKDLVSPFILRREKQKVLEELPEKLEKKVIVNMTKQQKLVYNSYVKIIKEAIKNNKGSIFSHLTKLRLLCLDPSLVLEDYNSTSCKVNILMDIVQNNIKIDRKILIFSQFTKALDLIKIHLENLNIKYSYLDGKISSKERLKRVKEFNEEKEAKVFLISLKAGGTGLNLTSANLVIHFDPWWNPSAENQATDRAYRIGQESNVEVLKLICKDTIEEKIVNLQDDKNSIIDSILDENIMNKNLNNLTKEDILDILS